MLWRSLYILYVLALYLTPLPFRRLSFGKRLREALERLGLLFVKLGQMLAALKLLAGPSQIALEGMWDSTKPLPFDIIRPIVERAIGQPLEAYFESFDSNAYASASIAQTHVAMRHGVKMMVKVRRPGVLAMVRQDVDIMRALLRVLSFVSRRVRSLRSAQIPEHIIFWLLEEIDFRNEAKNIAEFKLAYEGTPLVAPDVEFFCEDVLIETFLPGVPLNRWDEKHRVEGIDVQLSVRNFLSIKFGVQFRGQGGPLHADPHPANLIAMPDGRMGVVDFGLVVQVSKELLDSLNTAIFAVYEQDGKATAKAMLRLCNYSFPDKKKRKAFEKSVKTYVKDAHYKPFDYWLFGMLQVLVDHGVPAPRVAALIVRFGILANAVAQTFFPGSSTIELVGDEIEAGMWQRLRDKLASTKLLPIAQAVVERLEKAPTDIAKAIKDPLGELAEALAILSRAVRTPA